MGDVPDGIIETKIVNLPRLNPLIVNAYLTLIQATDNKAKRIISPSDALSATAPVNKNPFYRPCRHVLF